MLCSLSYRGDAVLADDDDFVVLFFFSLTSLEFICANEWNLHNCK